MSDLVSTHFGVCSLPREGRGVLVIGCPDEAETTMASALTAVGIPSIQVFRIRETIGLAIQPQVRRVQIVTPNDLTTGRVHLKLGTL